MCGGGGGAWKENQSEILDHARDLLYDDYLAESGGMLPSTDADKATWTSAMDKFNAWKAGEVAKQDSGQAWWQTYEAPSESHSGGGGGGGGGSPADPGAGIGPYPLSNRYFPQLTHAYETPQAQDWSQYGLIDPAYQPWTVQGGQQYVPDNVWNYAPPEITRGPVQYAGPPAGGLMHVAEHGPPSEPKDRPMTPQEMIESGLFDGNPGYGMSDDVGWDNLSDDRRAFMISLGFHPTRYPGSSANSNYGQAMGIGSPAGFGQHPGYNSETEQTNAEIAFDAS